ACGEPVAMGVRTGAAVPGTVAPEPAAVAPEPRTEPAEGDPVTPPPGTPPYADRLAPVLTARVGAALAWGAGPRPELAVWLVLAPVGVLLASIDHRVHRLPDALTLPGAGAAAVLLGPAALLPEHAGSWLSALLGGLALGGFYFL